MNGYMNQQFDPMQIIAMIKGGKNPEQILMNILETNSANNPILQNLMQLAKKGDIQGIENIARNISKERGIDYDKEFKSFKEKLGF